MTIIRERYEYICEYEPCGRPSPPQYDSNKTPRGWTRLRYHRPYSTETYFFCSEHHKKEWIKQERKLKFEW